jgi:DNA-directed RNA polymerase specialized sigma24 family protein
MMASSDDNTSEAEIVMTEPREISELIERSSLGTTGARSLRRRTPPEVAQSILGRAAEHELQHVTAKPSNMADLLVGIRNGDPAAWDAVLRRYGKLVSTTVRSFHLQDTDALDAVRMTWLLLAENAHQMRVPERLGGWLVATARRECLHRLRQSTLGLSFTDMTSETIFCPSSDPASRTSNRDTTQNRWELVEEFTPAQQALIGMLWFTKANPCSRAAEQPTRERALTRLRRSWDACLTMATQQ